MDQFEHRARSRPKDLEKRAAIVRAARRLFFDLGLAAVRFDRVAQKQACRR